MWLVVRVLCCVALEKRTMDLEEATLGFRIITSDQSGTGLPETVFYKMLTGSVTSHEIIIITDMR